MQTTALDKILERVLANEGGYANDPNDPGGETIFGISRRAHGDTSPALWKLVDELKRDREAFPANLEESNLARTIAAGIYRRDYWEPIHGDTLAATSERIAYQVFDFAVNAGVHRAAKTLQQAVNTCNSDREVHPDGIIGPRTLAGFERAAAFREPLLWHTYRDLRAEYYTKLARKRGSRFLFSWLVRVYET